MLVVGVLYVLALDAKEMAVTFPCALAMLELLVYWKPTGDWRALVRQFAPVGVFAGLTLVYIVGEIYGPNSITTNNAFRPTFSLGVWTESLAWYTSQLLYRDDVPVSPAFALGLWILLIVAAVVLRSRLAVFGILWAIVALLPIAFIGLRQGYVWYLSMGGFALSVAVVLRRIFAWRPAVRWALPVVIMLSLSPPHLVQRQQEGLIGAQSITWNALQQIQETQLQLPRGSSVLVKDEPFNGYYDLAFILRLYFDDPSLRVGLSSPGGTQIYGDVLPTYDTVLRFDDGRLVPDAPVSAEGGS
jgi:hypothetical protein